MSGIVLGVRWFSVALTISVIIPAETPTADPESQNIRKKVGGESRTRTRQHMIDTHEHLPTDLGQVVVEVHFASAQVAAQQGGVGGEDGGHGKLPSTAQHQPQAR